MDRDICELIEYYITEIHFPKRTYITLSWAHDMLEDASCLMVSNYPPYRVDYG